MIVFQNLRWKNFLSTGDNWTSISLDVSPTTLIVGHNGAGKSTMLDALSYALFGKAHRQINKPQLVNSINEKGCIVEIEFKVNETNTFKVIRGIKPNKFEIYKNGELLNQTSLSKDYQKYLEQNILNLNHKSFHQIVVLGTTSFIPFMKLNASARREVIEDFLDIGIFSKMNQVLKAKCSEVNDSLQNITNDLRVIDESINLQKRYISGISQINDSHRAEKVKRLDELKQSFLESTRALNSIGYDENDKVSLQQSITTCNDRHSRLKVDEGSCNASMTSLVKEANFLKNNTSCPTCNQEITDEFKNDRLDVMRVEAISLNNTIKKSKADQERIILALKGFRDELDKFVVCDSEANSHKRDILRIKGNIDSLEREIEKLDKFVTDVGSAHELLETLTTKQKDANVKLQELSVEKEYNNASLEMLKDAGIKTKIIKEYLPPINSLINRYLSVMDFFVSFEFDENFDETIKSRHRDNFNYSSFSEGEKQRIDLSLLFTWRQIAKMKNSTNTNLLVLDETFDSSLDNEGIDNLLKIINTIGENTNIFVISHKGDSLESVFSRKLQFTKVNGFSSMTTEN